MIQIDRVKNANSRLIDSMNTIVFLSRDENENSRVEKNDIKTIFLHVLIQVEQFDIDHENVHIIFFVVEFFQNCDAFRKFVFDTNHQCTKTQIL